MNRYFKAIFLPILMGCAHTTQCFEFFDDGAYPTEKAIIGGSLLTMGIYGYIKAERESNPNWSPKKVIAATTLSTLTAGYLLYKQPKPYPIQCVEEDIQDLEKKLHQPKNPAAAERNELSRLRLQQKHYQKEMKKDALREAVFLLPLGTLMYLGAFDYAADLTSWAFKKPGK